MLRRCVSLLVLASFAVVTLGCPAPEVKKATEKPKKPASSTTTDAK